MTLGGQTPPDLFQAHKHMDRRGLRVKSQEVTKKSIGSNPMKGEGQGRPGKAREGQGRPGKAMPPCGLFHLTGDIGDLLIDTSTS